VIQLRIADCELRIADWGMRDIAVWKRSFSHGRSALCREGIRNVVNRGVNLREEILRPV